MIFMSLLRSWAATGIASEACNCSSAVLHEIKACMIAGVDMLCHVQAKEPVLASFLHQNIISHASLGKAMAVLLANKLSSRTLLGTQLMQLVSDIYRDDPVSFPP